MEGYIKIEAIKDGLSVESKVRDMGILDRAHILGAIFEVLEIDISDANQVGLFCGLAKITSDGANRIMVDTGTIRRAAEKLHGDGE